MAGWSGSHLCEDKTAKFDKDYGVCIIDAKALLLATRPRKHFKKWQ